MYRSVNNAYGLANYAYIGPNLIEAIQIERARREVHASERRCGRASVLLYGGCVCVCFFLGFKVDSEINRLFVRVDVFFVLISDTHVAYGSTISIRVHRNISNVVSARGC